MKRKTNLFYLGQTQDSNFLSFSNYSESLTGNLISTDNKIFPSSFLCMNLKGLRDEEKAHALYDEKNADNIDAETWDSITGYKKKSLIFEMNKERLIKECLVPYYENKMATLRDWCIENNYNQEKQLLPLNYLLESIYKFEGIDEVSADNDCMVYYGDVTEQDYNGTFTDTICVIDSTHRKVAHPVYNREENRSRVYADLYDESDDYLHGWFVRKKQYDSECDKNGDGQITLSLYSSEDNKLFNVNGTFQLDAEKKWQAQYKKYNFVSNDMSDDLNTYYKLGEPKQEVIDKIIELAKLKEEWHGPTLYEDVHPIYDEVSEYGAHQYEVTSSIYELNVDESGSVLNDDNQLVFNVVIPLYDIIDTNWVSDDKTTDETMTTVSLEYNKKSSEQMIQNVPLGIWMSGPTDVVLQVDEEEKNGVSWSLALASQFKPFPASSMVPSEISTDSKKDAFMTFAQILTKQNELITSMADTLKTISTISDRLTKVESAVSSVLTSANIDDFTKRYEDFTEKVDDKIKALEATISDLELKWVNKEA